MLSIKIGLVAHPFRYAREPREIFRRVLSRKGEVGRALRLMHRLDFLGQYIPEFGQLTCLVQHDSIVTRFRDVKLLPWKITFFMDLMCGKV